jgi:hypothetical protein
MAREFKKQNMMFHMGDAREISYITQGEYAVNAISDFESKDIVTIRTKENESVKTLVPFHATRVVMYAKQFEDAEKPDPYGCTEGGGGEGSSKACEAKACSGKAGC